MRVKSNLIWVAILMLIMIVVTIIAIVTMVIMAFKLHILVGIFVLCAVIYWVCHRLMYVI